MEEVFRVRSQPRAAVARAAAELGVNVNICLVLRDRPIQTLLSEKCTSY